MTTKQKIKELNDIIQSIKKLKFISYEEITLRNGVDTLLMKWDQGGLRSAYDESEIVKYQELSSLIHSKRIGKHIPQNK